MNELTVRDIASTYGEHFMLGFARAQKVISAIESWDDVEQILLKGQGLAASTYKTYLTAIRQLYEYTEGLNPFQVGPGHIEAFYDDQASRVALASCYNKMAALKNFFRSIAKMAPGWSSPFDVMEPALLKKLTRQSHRGTKTALSQEELTAVLSFLKGPSLREMEDHAIILMLATSGLRAAELCGLTWGDISIIDGTAYAEFLGKGGKPAQQPLYGPAVTAARDYFRRHFRRDPKPEDSLFYTLPIVKTQPVAPLDPHALWYRVKKIGKECHAAGVVTRAINWSPHLLRRTFATSLYKSGMKLKAIQELTRHSDITVLADHYIDDREDPAPYFNRMGLDPDDPTNVQQRLNRSAMDDYNRMMGGAA